MGTCTYHGALVKSSYWSQWVIVCIMWKIGCVFNCINYMFLTKQQIDVKEKIVRPIHLFVCGT